MERRWQRVAKKDPTCIIEPRADGFSRQWESFCATNPAALRLTGDPRVFLGYRAAGEADRYWDGYQFVWGSSLGMAVLDRRGERVECRFPLPIMRHERSYDLPQDPDAYEAFMREHADDVIVLHDFRLWEHEGFLYVIFHEGRMHKVFDCIRRMPLAAFRERIERSLVLAGRPSEAIIDEWRELWWAADCWQPAGVDGTDRVYGSWVNKNDIIFWRLKDGSLKMCHRPYPDMAVLDTGRETFARPTPDGLTTFGTLETCVRPGCFDNAHIGSDGFPTPARIGRTDVYIDVTHGVWDRAVATTEQEDWGIIYMPYLRVVDAETGELLFYSEEPVADYDDVWREYVEDGAWIRRMSHLLGVMFPGGQVSVEPDRNGLDDEFAFYTGVGDTATARATFRLRDLLPERVVADIQDRPQHRRTRVTMPAAPQHELPDPVCGWHWKVVNDPRTRTVAIERTLDAEHGSETARRTIPLRPGYFDADLAWFDGHSVRRVEDLGYVLLYTGTRWTHEVDGPRATSGVGVMLLDGDLPERVLYRSTEPLDGKTAVADGWISGAPITYDASWLDDAENLIPERVRFEVRRIRHLVRTGKRKHSDMALWLGQKSGQLEPSETSVK